LGPVFGCWVSLDFHRARAAWNGWRALICLVPFFAFLPLTVQDLVANAIRSDCGEIRSPFVSEGSPPLVLKHVHISDGPRDGRRRLFGIEQPNGFCTHFFEDLRLDVYRPFFGRSNFGCVQQLTNPLFVVNNKFYFRISRECFCGPRIVHMQQNGRQNLESGPWPGGLDELHSINFDPDARPLFQNRDVYRSLRSPCAFERTAGGLMCLKRLPANYQSRASGNDDQPPIRVSPPMGPFDGCVPGWRVCVGLGLIVAAFILFCIGMRRLNGWIALCGAPLFLLGTFIWLTGHTNCHDCGNCQRCEQVVLHDARTVSRWVSGWRV